MDKEVEMELDLKDMLKIISKRKLLIIFITFIFTIVSAVISFYVLEPIYEAKVSVVIGKESARMFYEDRYTNSDVTMYQKLLKTYSEIASSNTVTEKTASTFEKYRKKDIIENTSAVPKADTQILEIKFKSKSPVDASDIANSLAMNFIDESKRILPAGELNILDDAEVPTSPISPNKKLNIAIAFFLGLMISVGLTFFLEYMDTKIKTEEQLKRCLDIPILVNIPKEVD